MRISMSSKSYSRAIGVTTVGVILLIAAAAIGAHIQITNLSNHSWTAYDAVAGAGTLTATAGLVLLFKAYKKALPKN